MAGSPLTQLALEELITSFNELNGASVLELDEEPSPLEFMRFVARNSPFVVRGGASAWDATCKWQDAAYLKAALRGHSVNVAVTPDGNADSPTFSPKHNQTVLAKPHEESQQFDQFLAYVIQQETDPSFPSASEKRYAQTRSTPPLQPVASERNAEILLPVFLAENDNLRDEYLTLFPDAQKDIPFARIALQKPPDAINLWIGNSHSATAAHKDNFENIFVQVVGRKSFVLLPPLCHPCMNERPLPPATYVRTDQGFSLCLDKGYEPVPFATWDPDDPETNATSLSPFARPLRVTLEPEDMLYLPAMWYHKVTQCCPAGGEGFVVAINYWYDMEFSGPLFPFCTFLRTLGKSFSG